MATSKQFEDFLKETCDHFITTIFGLKIEDKELNEKFIPFTKLYLFEHRPGENEIFTRLTDSIGEPMAYHRVGIVGQIKAVFLEEFKKHKASGIVECKIMYDTILEKPCYLVGDQVRYEGEKDPQKELDFLKEFLWNFPLSLEDVTAKINHGSVGTK